MNKQIEEIVEILKTSGAILYEPNTYRLPSEGFINKFFVTERAGRLTIDYGIFACAIINAGYRKQGEVATEIISEIEQSIMAHGTNYAMKRLAELKKKYEVKTE
jgi:hypothetical protein